MARVNVRNFTGLYLTRVEVNVHVRVHVVLLACLLDSPVKCCQALVRFLIILFDGVAYPAFIVSIRFRRIFAGFNRNPQFHGHEGETLQR